tara:strand:- start:386 stop:526 length:141 start_codon:yes stop_codon:yes gene_type:complete
MTEQRKDLTREKNDLKDKLDDAIILEGTKELIEGVDEALANLSIRV